jgi:hypothetical protein
MQYALWVPFAVVSHYVGATKMSYLFATWFVLGEAMLIYMHAAARGRSVIARLQWWHVVLVMGTCGAVMGAPLVGTFKRFVAEYVFFGMIVMALVFPLLPKKLLRDVPDMIFTLGFLRGGRPSFTPRVSEVDTS